MAHNSQTLNGPSSGRRIPAKPLALKASQTDDVSLIEQALTTAAEPDTRDSLEDIQTQAVRQSIRRGSNKVLAYVLEHGAKVPATSSVGFDETSPPPKETFEILLQHGWDINARQAGEHPFLWSVILAPELVEWALKHGAEVTPQQPLNPDPNPERQEDCRPLLETAASYGAPLSTFKLLQSKGAPLGKRTLHFAVRNAKSRSNPDDAEDESMALVQYLVDTVGLDVNALDQPQGSMLGNHWGTPLCYVAEGGPTDRRDVTRFLLERGADPHLKIEAAGWDAVSLAQKRQNQTFVETVQEWENEQSKAA